MESAEGGERQILADLEEIERRDAELEDRLVRIEDEIEQTRKALSRGDKDIESIGRSVGKQKDYLARRLRALYRLRDGGFLPVLIQAESISDLSRRYRYLRLILKRDEAALAEFTRRNDTLGAARAELEVERGRLLELKSELDRERDNIEETKRKKTALLMQVQRRKELYLAMIETREESRQRLIKEVIIEPRAKEVPSPPPPEVEDERPRKWPDFEKMKGKIPRPVPGEITGKFGRSPGPFNTVTQRYGLVFSTPAGVPVRSVLEGEVLYTGWVKGYGTIIIIDHGNRYYTLIGGLAGIKPETGQWVSEGEVLGLAPKGGKKDKKEIYFEIRHRGQAIDPAPWLGKNPVSQG